VATPKILFADIETSPNTVYTWGLWRQNISHDHIELSSAILCWSAKWLGHSTIIYKSIQHDTPKEMLSGIHKLLDEADIVVTYNGMNFDLPTLNKEFLTHGLTPPSPYKQVDMLRVVRAAFRFESNKLDAVLKTLSMGQKVKHRGFQLWVGCMKGDTSCWEEMRRYNKGDVQALEKLYKRVLPWISAHPLISAYRERLVCDKCGSKNTTYQGTSIKQRLRYPQYQCNDCGGWSTGRKAVKR